MQDLWKKLHIYGYLKQNKLEQLLLTPGKKSKMWSVQKSISNTTENKNQSNFQEQTNNEQEQPGKNKTKCDLCDETASRNIGKSMKLQLDMKKNQKRECAEWTKS